MAADEQRVSAALLAGGLGNQLFQLAAAVKVAQGGPVELIHGLGATRNAPDGSPDISGFLKPEVARITRVSSHSVAGRVSAVAAARLLSLSVSSKRGARLQRYMTEKALATSLRRSSSENYRCFGADGVGNDVLPHDADPHTLLVGYFQSWKIALADDVLERVKQMQRVQESDWLEDLRTRAEVELPTVVHIRLGDYRQEPDFGFPGVRYLRKALSVLADRGQRGRIWLFSDEPARALSILKEDLNERDVRVVPPSSEVSSPASVLAAMSLAHSIVTANSTFSWWGAALSRASGRAICVPQPWFIESKASPDLVPSHWTAVPAHSDC